MNGTAGWLAITQRSEHIARRAETGDFLDRRFFTLPALAGHRLLPVPGDLKTARRLLEGITLDAVLLSGGNDLPQAPGADHVDPQRDQVESWLLERAAAEATVVIGICRGAQMIAAAHGARLGSNPAGHAGTRHTVRATAAQSVPAWPRTFPVASHHRHVVTCDGFPQDLEILAVAEDDTVEAFAHRDLPWWGLMWHPEREGQPGPGQILLDHAIGRLGREGRPA